MSVKISKQLERSNCSLLSADNSIPEESEDEEEDIEEERIGKLGEEETKSSSSFMPAAFTRLAIARVCSSPQYPCREYPFSAVGSTNSRRRIQLNL